MTDDWIISIIAVTLIVGLVVGLVGVAVSGDARWMFILVPAACMLWMGARRL